MRQISAVELKEMLARPPQGFQLVDVREPWEHETVHLKGSVLIPMREIPHRLEELNKDRPVALYCHHGIRSMQVGAFLERFGFQEVLNLEGGIDAYSEDADRSLRRY